MTNNNAYVITFRTYGININAPRNCDRFVRGKVVKTKEKAREYVQMLMNHKGVREIVSVRDRSGKNFLAEIMA